MTSIRQRITRLEAEMWEFSPVILQAQRAPPSPLPRVVLYTLLGLFAVLLLTRVCERVCVCVFFIFISGEKKWTEAYLLFRTDISRFWFACSYTPISPSLFLISMLLIVVASPF